jgi:hypothetical protein
MIDPKIFESLRKMMKDNNFVIMTATQIPRPPGYYPTPPRSEGPDLVIIDYMSLFK